MDEAKKQFPTTTTLHPHLQHRLFLKGSYTGLEQLWDEVSADEYVHFMHGIIHKHHITEIVWDGDLINPKYFTHYFPQLFASLLCNEKLCPPAAHTFKGTSSLTSSSSNSPPHRQVKNIRAYRCKGRENLDSLRANLEAHLLSVDEGGGAPYTGVSIQVLEYEESSPKHGMMSHGGAHINTISTITSTSTATTCNHPPTLYIHESDVEPRFYKDLGWYAMRHSTSCGKHLRGVSHEDVNFSHSKVDGVCGNEGEKEKNDDNDDASSVRNVIVSMRGGMVTKDEFERARREEFSSMWYCLIVPGSISEINEAYGHVKEMQVLGEDIELVLKRWRYGGHVYRI